MTNIANLVSVGRVGLALITASLLWSSHDSMHWLAFALTVLVIYSDALDGYLARKLKQATKFGGKLDIACDRAVEMIYWIAFAILNWIPVWIAFLFLIRGNFVDVIRAQASEVGLTAFGETSMQKNVVGRFLVASNFSRFTYAVVKAVAFCLLIAAHTSYFAPSIVPQIASFFVYLSVIFCLIRALPVFFEGQELINK